MDEGCRKEVLYPPEEISQPLIGQTVSNIREDRTDLDLLYACLLDLGLGMELIRGLGMIFRDLGDRGRGLV